MRWTAHTDFSTIAPRTVLHILASGQVKGQPPDKLTAGATLDIHTPNTRYLHAIVISVSATEAVIEIDGTRWRMTPWTKDDLPQSFGTSSHDHRRLGHSGNSLSHLYRPPTIPSHVPDFGTFTCTENWNVLSCLSDHRWSRDPRCADPAREAASAKARRHPGTSACCLET